MLELLRERKFKTVVIIDDDNAIPPIGSIDALAREIVKAKARRRVGLAAALPFLREACDLANPESQPDQQARQSDVRGWLTQHEDQITNDRLREAAEVLFQGVTGQTHSKLRAVIKADDGLELKAYSFEQWKESRTGVLAAASPDARVLLLVDEINDKEPHVDLNGQSVLMDMVVSGATNLPFVDAMMITSNCAPDSELEKSHELYDQVCELLIKAGHQKTFKKVFVLSKARLEDHTFVTDFTVYMNRIEASRLSGELADAAKKVVLEAAEESLDWLKSIPLLEFHHSIFVTAQTEGAAEIDTLVRLASIRQRVALEKLLRMDPVVQSRIEEMRKIMESGFGARTSVTIDALRQLRQEEYERTGAHVNILRAPIACGDVFKFETTVADGSAESFEAILLVNPCDLVLRKEGERKLSTGLLVQVKKSTRKNLSYENSGAPLVYRLATGGGDSDIIYTFYNSKVESIPLYVLDLCWLNESGDASLSPDKLADSLPSLAQPQRNRVNILLGRAVTDRFPIVELWGNALQPTVKDFESRVFGALNVSKGVTYKVSRVWRLAPEFSAAALSALSQAISRPAFGHDYLQQ